MEPSGRQTPRSEGGFTLVELLTAITISTIVLLATLRILDGFSSDSSRQTRVIDANDQARTTMGRIVRDLRHASTVTRATRNDLVYTVKDSTTATRHERVCLDGAGGLWGARSATSSDPGPSCPTAATGWSGGKIATRASTNSETKPIFSYDRTDAAGVRSIGITFSLDATSGGRPGGSTLRASAFLRSRVEMAPVVAPGDVEVDCEPTGPLLSFGLLSNLLNGPVSITVNGVVLSGPTFQATNGVNNVIAITNALGLTTMVSRVVACD